jgi:hypothetical protein
VTQDIEWTLTKWVALVVMVHVLNASPKDVSCVLMATMLSRILKLAIMIETTVLSTRVQAIDVLSAEQAPI